MSGENDRKRLFYRKDFENCDRLEECENKLKNTVLNLNFLGQIDITRKSFQRLEELVKGSVKNLHEKVAKLFKSYPNSFSFYLVLKGVYEYEGSYWSKIRKPLGIDTNDQNDIGKEFLRYLEDKELVKLEKTDRFRYCDNILLQGFLPLSKLDDFMGEDTLSKIISQDSDQSPTEKARILGEARSSLESVKNDIADKEKKMGKFPRKLSKYWEELEHLSELESEIKPVKDILNSLRKNPNKFRRRLKVKLLARHRHASIVKNYIQRYPKPYKRGPIRINKLKISSRLNELEGEKESARERINQIDDALRELGDGDLKSRAEKLEELRERTEELKEAKKNLKEKLEDQLKLADLWEEKALVEKKARKLNKSAKEYIDDKISKKERLIQDKKNYENRIESLESDLEGHERLIRNFLLYGNKFPELIKKELKKLQKKQLKGNEINYDDYELPTHYIQAFLDRENEDSEEEVGKSKEEKKSKEEDLKSSGIRQRLRKPRVSFDIADEKVTVKLPSQTIKGLEKARETEFCVSGTCKNLKPFRESEEYYTTKEHVVELEPGEEYSFRLLKGGETLNSWKVKSRTEEFIVWAFELDGGLCRDEKLPKGEVWLVLPEKISPEGNVKISGSMDSNWRGYQYYKVDLSEDRSLVLTKNTGQKIRIPVVRGSLPDIEVSEKNLVEGALLNDLPVFSSIPRIKLPFQEHDNLEKWNLVIYRTLTDREEVQEIGIDLKESTLEVPDRGKYCRLNLSEVNGLDSDFSICRVVLQNKEFNYSDEKTFCHVKGIKYDFSEAVYLPEKNGLEKGKVNLKVPHKLNVESEFDGRLTRGKGGIRSADFSMKNNQLIFELQSREYESSDPYRLKIEVPKLKWSVPQLKGKVLEAKTKSKSLYFLKDLEKQEDLDLNLTLPSYFTGKAILSLTNSRKKSEGSITKGRVKFDLKGFLDALRHGREEDKTVQTFKVSFPEREELTGKIDLFTVQNHWEVINIQASKKEEKDKIRIKARWQVIGRAENEVALIWRKKNHEKILKEKLDTSSESFEAVLPKGELDSGEYILHVTNQPPYSGEEIEYPVESVRDLYNNRVDFQPSTVVGENERIEHKSYVDNLII